MASFQKSQYVDVLSVRKIYAKGDSNITLSPNLLLATDGEGGTSWIDSGIISGGLSFNTFITTPSTFVSGPSNKTFSILDGENAGLLASSSGNTVNMYAKAFGKINVAGADSINAFDNFTGLINSNVSFIGSGIINISTDTTQNIIKFNSPNDAISTMSTAISNLSSLNISFSNAIQSFSSPFSTIMYNILSSFSTSLGPVVTVPVMNTAFSSFSTALGPIIQYSDVNSALSTFSTALGETVIIPVLNSTISSFSTVLGPTVTVPVLNLAISNLSSFIGPVVTDNTFRDILSTATSVNFYTNTINVSSILALGNRQPFIQYGQAILPLSGNIVISVLPYIDTNYTISLTYANASSVPISPLYMSSITTSNFLVIGDYSKEFHWTTYGNMF